MAVESTVRMPFLVYGALASMVTSSRCCPMRGVAVGTERIEAAGEGLFLRIRCMWMQGDGACGAGRRWRVRLSTFDGGRRCRAKVGGVGGREDADGGGGHRGGWSAPTACRVRR